MQSTLGQKLIINAALTEREAVLVAPFIKMEALRRILRGLTTNVSVTVITRWIPAEILGGVSDLEVFDLLQQRGNAHLYINQLLHAKSYRFDDSIWIGSANITSKALGWASPSNLEILVPASLNASEIRRFEIELLRLSTKVDSTYREHVSEQVKLLAANPATAELYFEAHISSASSSWLPSCRDPRRLWIVYSDPENAKRRIVESAYAAAVRDLFFLEIPVGLPESKFRELVAASLDALPVVIDVAIGAKVGLTEEDACELIRKNSATELRGLGLTHQWEVLRAWLIEFFPNVYRHESYPDMFRISKVL